MADASKKQLYIVQMLTYPISILNQRLRQGVRTLSEPTKLFCEMVDYGQIVHDGNPLSRWWIAIVMQKEDRNENIVVSKPNKSSSKRIDLLAAILNAFVCIQAPRDAIPQNYSDSDRFGF